MNCAPRLRARPVMRTIAAMTAGSDMIRALTIMLATLPLAACVAGAALSATGRIVGAAVGVTGAVVETGVKVTGAVVDAAIHDRDDKDPDDDER